jgi:hypothetical protein
MIIHDLIVLFFAVPISMWIIRTTKQDKLNLAWIVTWSALLFVEITSLEILVFLFGLVLGILTDFAGVLAKKWWYPHYDERLYSFSAFWGWGIVTLIIYRIYIIIVDNLIEFGWILLLIFIVSWIIVELWRGKTSFTNYLLIIRTFIIILFLTTSGDLLFLFVAAAGALYFEVLGTYLRIWIYYDPPPSYLYLGTGYAQLSYLCIITANFLIYSSIPNFIQITLIIILIFLYLLDYRNIIPSQDTKDSKNNHFLE